MRKDFATRFWHEAHQSLPAELRPRYLTQMQAAERWELAIGRLVERADSDSLTRFILVDDDGLERAHSDSSPHPFVARRRIRASVSGSFLRTSPEAYSAGCRAGPR